MDTDVLVIGCGVAGCATALKLARRGVRVCMLSETSETRESNSFLVQRGVAFLGEGDSEKLLAEDLRQAAGASSNIRAIEYLAEAGPKAVKEFLIDDLGVAFDRSPEGKLCFSKDEKHSKARTLYFRDHTGKAVMDSFLRLVSEEANIELMPGHSALKLITLAEHSVKKGDAFKRPTCLGAYVLDKESGKVLTITAKETVLATGGLGSLYRYSSNTSGSVGAGYALASEAGARLAMMGEVQFNALAFWTPNQIPYLLSSALREQGARILNKRGEEITSQGTERELAKAVFLEMQKSQADHLWLDLSEQNVEWLKDRFSTVYDLCESKGYDLSREPIPVVPVAHHALGGVLVDKDAESSVQRLRCVGEVACTGVQGRQGLPSTMIMEALVWASSLADDVAKQVQKFAYYCPELLPFHLGVDHSDNSLAGLWRVLKECMWNDVGPVRTRDGLLRAQRVLDALGAEQAMSFAALQFKHALTTAKLVVADALATHPDQTTAVRELASEIRQGQANKACVN